MNYSLSKCSQPYLHLALFFALLAMPTATASAQAPNWLAQLGSAATDLGLANSVDQDGSTFTAGYTRGDLAGSNSGSSDLFLAKHDVNGKQLWIRQIGTSVIDTCFGVTTDDLGNAYVVGYTYGDLAGVNPSNNEDAFLIKYDPSGNQIWARQFGTVQDDRAFGVATDSNGNVFVTGDTAGDLAGPQSGSRDAFLRKYSSNGDVVWTRQYGGTTFDNMKNITCDAQGNVVVAGATGNYSTIVLVVKYDSDGNELWFQNFGTGLDRIEGVITDELNNVYLSGSSYSGFGDVSLGGSDGILIKLREDGKILFIKQFGTSSHDFCDDVIQDPFGNLVVSGHTSGDFAATNAGSQDIFVAKFTPAGGLIWKYQYGTELGDQAKGIGANGANLFLSGYTHGDFGNVNQGERDAFIVSLKNITPVLVAPDTVTPIRGNLVAGGLAEIALSDNNDLTMQRGVQDVQSRTEFEVRATSPFNDPFVMLLKIEGSVFARTKVYQSVQMFNFSDASWETVGSTPASSFSDSTFVAEATGDLTRFVEAETGLMRARVHFQSDRSRQRFSSNTDLVEWAISN